MRNAARIVLSAALGLSFVVGATAEETYPDPAPPVGEERAALFAWFDGLGFPDVTRGDVVAVSVGGMRAQPGFVIERGDDLVRVASLELREIAARPQTDEEPAWKRITMAPLDLEQAVRDELGLSAEKRAGPVYAGADVSHWLTARARQVVLARACAARGLESQAHALLGEASRIPGLRDWAARMDIPLRERIEDDLEQVFRVRLFSRAPIDDLSGWRDEIAAFARRFPRGRNVLEARHHVRVLDRMIAEAPSIPTEEHALAQVGPARARALVQRLRTMAHWSPAPNGGATSPFATDGGLPASAADHLLAMGETAVPALIDALEDDTLTGLASEGRNGWSPRVTTVADCAVAILRRLAPEGGFTPAQFATREVRRSAPQDARALVDRIERREEPLAAARELVAKHPGLAYWPLVLGWTAHPEDLADVAASNAWIDVLCELDDPRVPERLARRALWGGRLTGTVASIVALARSDPERALELAVQRAEYLHEESHATPSRGSVRQDLDHLCRAENEAAERLVAFLVQRGRTDVLDRRFARQWPHVKVMIARALVREAQQLDRGDAGTILRAALADATPLEDLRAIELAKGVTAPRVNDAAAAALHALDAARFPFTPKADVAVRDRQIDALAELLRSE